MSLAVAYGMKKRKKMADGGDSKKEWEGNKSPRGGYMHPKRPNDKEKMDPDTGEISSSDSRESEYLHEVREGNRKEQSERQGPKRPLKGLAHGGETHEDREKTYKGDKGTSSMGSSVRSANRSKSWAKDERSSSPSIERSMAKDAMGRAKETAAANLYAEHDRPQPKLKGLADGGELGINRQDAHRRDGTSEAGHFAKYTTSSGNSDGSKDWTNNEAKKKHHEVIGEMRALPKPKLKGLADGGPIDELMEYDPMEEPGVMPNEPAMMEDDRMQDRESDLVDRIIKKMSEGGMIANGGDEDPETHPGSLPNEFDDLALRDDLSFSYTGANSGDEKGDQRLDDDNDDIVSRILRSRAKKDRLPNPR